MRGPSAPDASVKESSDPRRRSLEVTNNGERRQRSDMTMPPVTPPSLESLLREGRRRQLSLESRRPRSQEEQSIAQILQTIPTLFPIESIHSEDPHHQPALVSLGHLSTSTLDTSRNSHFEDSASSLLTSNITEQYLSDPAEGPGAVEAQLTTSHPGSPARSHSAPPSRQGRTPPSTRQRDTRVPRDASRGDTNVLQ